MEQAGVLSLSLRVSRPYFWLVTLWLYLLPTGRSAEVFRSGAFWLGLAYCTYPLNLLCYWMNDYSDVSVDEHNPRKGGALMGIKEDRSRLRDLARWTATVQLPFVLAFVWLWGPIAVPWFLSVVAVNWAYNFGPRLSSNHAPLDLFCPCGYLLVVHLSCALTDLPLPRPAVWLHAIFLVVRTQLWLQTFDIDTDARAGRKTTAVLLGLRRAQTLLGAVLSAEAAFVLAYFTDWALQSFSIVSVGLLALQVSLAPSAAALSPASMNATFAILGLGGYGLMVQVWVNGAFL
jgi:4-hydroxybenzoate polyprenyltransferase